MSKPRRVMIKVNISIAEQVNQRIELNSVLGQNIPQRMLELLQQGPGQWRPAPGRENVYRHDVPNSRLWIELDGSESPIISVAVIGRLEEDREVLPDQAIAERQAATAKLQREIKRHEAECNQIFNSLVNEAIREAILRMAQHQGEVQENGWQQVQPQHSGRQRLELRVRVPA